MTRWLRFFILAYETLKTNMMATHQEYGAANQAAQLLFINFSSSKVMTYGLAVFAVVSASVDLGMKILF